MMKKYLFYGLGVAIISSIVGGSFTYFYYQKMFDFSEILPIWKVVSVFISFSLFFSFLLYFFQKAWKNRGVFILNTLICIGTVCSIIYPMTYVNQNVEFVEMLPILSIPLHFILPLIWLACQPLVITFEK